MDVYSCTCGGENPNCFKCDGTGLVSKPPPVIHIPGRPRSPLSASTSSGGATPTASPTTSRPRYREVQAPASSASQIRCRLCSVVVENATELLLHLRAEHPRPFEVGGANSKNTPAPKKKKAAATLRPCPQCGAPVGDVERHYKRIHSPEGIALKQERKKKARSKAKEGPIQSKIHEQTRRLHEMRRMNPRAVLCGMCGVVVPSSDELRLHLRSVHGFSAAAATPSSVPGTASLTNRRNTPVATPQASRSGAATGDPYLQEARERKMDATYGMGGTARDHGRFGSAASYDGMDDESSP